MSSDLDVVLLRAGDPAVDAELDAFFDACPTSFAQQTTAWRDVITAIDRDEPLFLGARRHGELVGVLPSYRFDGPLGAILTSVPQAGPLGGIATAPDVSREPVFEALLAAFVRLAEERGCALASVISNPFWADQQLYERFLHPDFVLANRCQALDLARAVDDEGQIVDAPSHLRRNLSKALSGPLRVDLEQTPQNVVDWYAIHAARHQEIGATPLPRAMFTAALDHMVPKDKARFVFVRMAETDEMVAGGFYIYHGSVIDALMPAVRSEFAALAPSYLLALHTIRWARQRGLRYYNWQASPPDGGVHRFKAQWGSQELEYSYLTRVTGDARPFLRSSVEAVAEAYRWHYALPFDQIGAADRAGAGRPASRSDRSSAWKALEPGEP